MASHQRRRKQDALERKYRSGKSAASRDGDRRRKHQGPLYRTIQGQKQKLREWNLDDGPPPDSLFTSSPGPPTLPDSSSEPAESCEPKPTDSD